MKISYNHLKQLLNQELKKSPKEIEDILNQMGSEVEEVETIGDDTVIEIEITPNRGDLLSAIGIAREVCAAIEGDISVKEFEKKNFDVDNTFEVKNELETKDCPIYNLRKIEGVEVKESPDWVKETLEKYGIKSINNIVDATNLVMIETGQPSHAFDANTLKGDFLLRYAKEGETFVGIDKIERKMKGGELVMVDETNELHDLLGTHGGLDSSVTEKTTDIYLEAAYFDPVKVRTQSRSLGISTDASYRFERGVDPEMIDYAFDLVTDLILQTAGGKVVSLCHWDNFDRTETIIETDYKFISNYIGVEIKPSFAKNALLKLGFKVTENGENISVKVPSWRKLDVKRDVCIVEEVGKVYGFNNVPSLLPRSEFDFKPKPKYRQVRDRIEEFLIEKGFNHVINYGFVSEKDFSNLNLPSSNSEQSEEERSLTNFVTINVPLTEDYTVMRTSQIPGLIKNFQYNLNRGIKNFKLFETGRTFFKTDEIFEVNNLSGLISGDFVETNWRNKGHKADFYDMKSVLFALFDELEIPDEKLSLKSTNLPMFDADSAEIHIDGSMIGYFGKIKPGLVKMKNPQDIFVFEINLDQLETFAFTEHLRLSYISKYPSTERDLSFVCDKGFESAKVIDTVKEYAGGLYKSGELYDVYEGKNIKEGKISLAYNFVFQSMDRALTNEEVNEIMDKAIEKITSENEGVSLRG